MADGQQTSVLKRKTEAGRTSVAASRQVTPSKALGAALVQAADGRLGLAAAVKASTERTATLAELLEILPEGGLLAVLEGAGEAQGVLALDQALLSSIIEKTMTGRLGARPPKPRRPTRTDASLTADLIDTILGGFEAPFAGTPTARWASGFGYSSFLDDPRPLGLMLEDIDYRMLSLAIDLDNGTRQCSLVLAVPADGAGGASADGSGHLLRPAPSGSGRPAPVDRPSGRGADNALPSQTGSDEGEGPSWSEALASGVMRGRVALTAVLHRFDLPIASLEALRPGLELPIPASAIDECVLIGSDGLPVADGRLGQSRAMRALRLHAPASADGERCEPSPDVDTIGAEWGGSTDGDALSGAPSSADDLSALAAQPPLGLSSSGTEATNETALDDPLAGLPPPPPLPDLPGLSGLPESGPAGLPALPDLPD